MEDDKKSGLWVKNISKAFGSVRALNDVSFHLPSETTTAILGPSGCGKSTLLNLIAGLDTPDNGDVFWNNQSLQNIPANHRGFGLMFQDYALFPHLNVYQNISFGLQMKHIPLQAINGRVAEMLGLVGLDGFEKRDINNLSGGEAQRVALARSLAPQPSFLMLDEPFGSLDRNLRDRLTSELRTILHAVGLTALYVTHDQEEAFSLASQIIVMNQGRVVQIGSPQDIYQKPANVFVARFIGLPNLLPATGYGDHAQTAIGWLPLPYPKSGQLTVLLRPDSLHLAGDTDYQLEGKMMERIFLGSICRAIIDFNGTVLTFDFPPLACVPEENQIIRLSYDPTTAVQIISED